MGLETTAQLLDLVLADDGGEDARGALLERLRPRLVLWSATRMSPALRAQIEPDDVAQEVLLAVHKALDGFEGRGQPAFFAWLFRIAENRIRDQVDRVRAKKRTGDPPPLSFSQTSPSTAAWRQERVAEVRAALDELKPEYQEVIRLRRLQELGTEEVARIMDRSPNAVRVLYCRALKALGAVLQKGDASAQE